MNEDTTLSRFGYLTLPFHNDNPDLGLFDPRDAAGLRTDLAVRGFVSGRGAEYRIERAESQVFRKCAVPATPLESRAASITKT